MKFKYNKEDDILLIELNDQNIDYAEQSGDLIVHFSPKREAVLLEILDASVFLKQAAMQLPKNIVQSILPRSTSPSIAYKKK
ncbi:hypothetical protein A2690_01960 [Candidatus Roizmanbacteria bacterium RIFCSPHIGHO2_01_FULL_39_12b]|uniref:DUF2283 domain-containing protein n=1 Tax=Candidatus Roizmanbacteria bacterium RIFCSPHIGHO2_01_FULL_39_12b TaxID=1802030 RepID=A0A1F7GBE1_9BACT|nr:MAG: hypothetical protein A2690_01960 [Candidatus Roizmanbacteria bacterium RIFCSPHIGHO2_01_FULL_39_12b]OGK46187.1 MAG: hypothetical protein A3B46_03205 [Candidatus Roizmanbacteria bacterium RIFCSPLOWO2_01_FULL_39_19]